MSSILNCLSPGETITEFASFYLAPVRDEAPGLPGLAGRAFVERCAPEEAEFYSIYGVTAAGDAKVLHDETGGHIMAVGILARLHTSTRKPVQWFDAENGWSPLGNLRDLADWFGGCLGRGENGGTYRHPLYPIWVAFASAANGADQ